jgi:hypothetical protein
MSGKSRSKRPWLVVGLILLVGLGIVLCSKPILIMYHAHYFRRVQEQYYFMAISGGLDGSPGELLKEFEYHRQKLVELGYFSLVIYRYEHIKASTSQASAVKNEIRQGNHPKLVFVESHSPQDS